MFYYIFRGEIFGVLKIDKCFIVWNYYVKMLSYKKNLFRIFEGRNVRYDGIYGEKLLDFFQNVIVGVNN